MKDIGLFIRGLGKAAVIAALTAFVILAFGIVSIYDLGKGDEPERWGF